MLSGKEKEAGDHQTPSRCAAAPSEWAGLGAWAEERFPLAHGALFLVLYVAAVLYGRFSTGDGPLTLGLEDAWGFLATWSFFLMLRVFDEHKDYALDCRNHPERVLQRGLVTLGHLKGVGALAIVFQLGVSLWLDWGLGPIAWRWLLVMGWTLLMAREFFCGEWLKRRLLLYAASHMAVMPMALLWMASMGAVGRPLHQSSALVALLSFLLGAAVELTRKTWAPVEERETVDSYNRVFGARRAPLVVMGFLVAAAAVEAVVLRRIVGAQGPTWQAAVLVAASLPVLSLYVFRRCPSASGRRRNEATVALFVFTAYGLLAAALVVKRGLAWA